MAESLHCDRPVLADRGQLYELLISELTDFAVFLTDPAGCITSWNPGVERVLGYAESEWLGRPVNIIFTPEDRTAKKPNEEMAKAAQGGRTPDVRWHQRKDGSRLFVEGTMVALKDGTGQLLGFSKVMRDITERKRAEEELQRARAEAHTILESITDGFSTFDKEWRVIYLNAAAEHILGMRREEVLGKNHWELFPETLGTAVEYEYRRAVREGFSVEFELLFAPWQRWMSVKCYPTKDGGLSVYFRDITEQKHADDELRRQRRTFDALLSHIPDHSYLLDLDGHFIYANQAVLGLWHKPLDEVVGRHMAELIVVPEVADLLVNDHRQVIRTGQPVRHESVYTPPGGEAHYFEYILSPVFAADGALEAVAGATRDMTAQKAAEAERERLLQQIAIERQRLQQVFSEAPVAIVVFRGPEFVIELANPFFRDLVQGRELVGRRFAEVVPDIGSAVWAAFHHVMDTGDPYVRDDFYVPYDQNGDGVVEDHWFNVFYHPLREDGAVSGLVSVWTEVTTQVRARQELERANRGLEEFAYVASHDLQEPLRMINSYSQLLVNRLGPDATDEQKQFAGVIQRGVKRMEQLIRDLLSYSRTVHTIGDTAVSEASLNEALRQALTAVDTRITETGATITHEPLPDVRGDTLQLTHVLQNLLSNALKYRKSTESPRIHISAQRQGSEWVISVRDNGIGFDSGQAQRIFGLFKRLHAEGDYPGTGLGLAICQRIVERYGGRIWAESEPGVGSTFYFSLPLGAR